MMALAILSKGAEAMNISWTDEKIAELKSKHQEGWSASEIARLMGGGLSRNAIIGKMARLNLSNEGRPKCPPVELRAKPGKMFKPVKPFVREIPPDPPKPPRFKPERVCAAPDDPVAPLLVDIMALRESSCRWPYGEPGNGDMRYCGCARPIGKSYCQPHMKLSAAPREVRKSWDSMARKAAFRAS